MLSDILRRFRPATAPGPAGRAGVPADRLAEADVELAPVFAGLASAVAAARRLRDEARAQADRPRGEAALEADRIVAEARSRVEAVRAETAAARLAAVDAERARLEAEARAEAERIRQAAAGRIPDLVARVVAGVAATGVEAPAVAGDAPAEVLG